MIKRIPVYRMGKSEFSGGCLNGMRKTVLLPIIMLFIMLTSCSLSGDIMPAKLPVKSTQNMLTLTSNGCCFWVEKVEVLLKDDSGKEIVISNNDSIYEFDIFKYEIPDIQSSPVDLVLKFRSFYGDECDFSSSVMKYENVDKLKETGVLLYFQERDDMYLNVISGDNHVSYKRGDKENRWTVMETPNEVYP